MHAKVARVRHLIARQKVAERTERERERVSTVYNVNLVVVCLTRLTGLGKILGNLGTR